MVWNRLNCTFFAEKIWMFSFWWNQHSVSLFFFKEEKRREGVHNKSGLYWPICSAVNQENIRAYAYLRAKEKWAEALGEKFLGLSCGLVPASKTQRSQNKFGFSVPFCSQKNPDKLEQSTDCWIITNRAQKCLTGHILKVVIIEC